LYRVLRQGESRDPRGERLGYNEIAQVWGEAAREGYGTINYADVGGATSTATYRFRTRFTPMIDPGDIMIDSLGRELRVRSVSDVYGDQRFLQIVAEQAPAEVP
jgi:hypothetical protein